MTANNFNIAFVVIGGIVTLFALVVLILAAPGAKRTKHSNVK